MTNHTSTYRPDYYVQPDTLAMLRRHDRIGMDTANVVHAICSRMADGMSMTDALYDFKGASILDLSPAAMRAMVEHVKAIEVAIEKAQAYSL